MYSKQSFLKKNVLKDTLLINSEYMCIISHRFEHIAAELDSNENCHGWKV